METCETCHYSSIVDFSGVCRRNAPVVAWTYVKDSSYPLTERVFPPIYKNSWCGEYAPKPAKEE